MFAQEVGELLFLDAYGQEMFESTSFIIINIQECCLGVQI